MFPKQDALDDSQRLFEVGLQVSEVFNAEGEAHEIIPNAEGMALL